MFAALAGVGTSGSGAGSRQSLDCRVAVVRIFDCQCSPALAPVAGSY